ncbi:MAG TPA: hypothetical protein DIT05_06035 [Morganella sp. (in: Bacteria)]|nr:hypothetical protein [Morganella sp. (in: enterobacteria)]
MLTNNTSIKQNAAAALLCSNMIFYTFDQLLCMYTHVTLTSLSSNYYLLSGNKKTQHIRWVSW